jgi:predicted nucleotidyltransferase
MTLDVPPWAAEVATGLPYPLVFATVSGAHLYGFASVDSDFDLRAAHVLPAAEVLGLRTGPSTVQHDGLRDGIELDVVSHDLHKFAKLLASPNGYVLEQLLSPLVVVTSDLHDTLRALAPGLISRGHAHHYLGFGAGQQRLYERTGEVKPPSTRCASCSPAPT